MSSVSVLIPTYNRAATLPHALASAMTQSRPPDEIIVIDDGSQDDTGTLIKQHYPHVVYLKQANRGVSAARNLGIQHASGEWIALLDSDDQWLPEKLETQRALLAQHPQHKLVHSDEIWIRNGVRVNPMKKHAKKGGWIFQHCLPMCAISPSAAMLHRSLFDEIGMFDESLPACEDYDLWLRITARQPVLYCETALIKKFGGHEDQLSRQHWGMDRFRIQALDNILRSNSLNQDNYLAALNMLLRKTAILLKGAYKHHNQAVIKHFEPLLRHWTEVKNAT